MTRANNDPCLPAEGTPTWDREDQPGADPAPRAVSNRSALGQLRQFAPGDTDPSTGPRSAAPGTMKSYGGVGPDRILTAVAIRAVSAMVSAQTRS